MLLRHAASLVWHQKFDATFDDPNGPHRMGADRKRIGWSSRHISRVSLPSRWRDRSRCATPLPGYGSSTASTTKRVSRAGGAELRLLEVHDVDHSYVVPRTYATIDGDMYPLWTTAGRCFGPSR